MPAIGRSVKPIFFGRKTIDVRDYGVFPGVGNATTTTSGLYRAAIDLANNAPATLYIPAGDDKYYVNRPIYVWGNNIEIVGENRPVINRTSYVGDIFRIMSYDWTSGINGPVYPATSANKQDLFGLLDSSIVTNSNQKWGFRSRNNFAAVCWTNPFCVGPTATGASPATSYPDYWQQTSQITIELGYVAHQSGGIRATTLAANGDRASCTFNIFTDDDGSGIYCRINTASGYLLTYQERQNTRYHQIRLDQPQNSGIHHACWQFDLSTLSYQGYMDGIQRASGTLSQTGPEYAGNGMVAGFNRLKRNNYLPFGLNCGSNRVAATESGLPGNSDWTCAGLRISKTLRYNNVGNGSSGTRVGGGTINDSFRYYTNDSNVIGYMVNTSGPNFPFELIFNQGSASNNSLDYGLIVLKNGYPQVCENVTVRELAFKDGVSALYGAGASFGLCPNLKIIDVSSRGGFAGIHANNFGSGVHAIYQQITVGGIDACLHLQNQSFTVTDVFFESSSKSYVHLVGCNATVQEIITASPNTQVHFLYYAIDGDIGGPSSHVIRGFNFNNESTGKENSNAVPFYACYVIEPPKSTEHECLVYIAHVNTADGANTRAPGLLLAGQGSTFSKGKVILENVLIYANTIVTVEDTDLWSGEVRDVRVDRLSFPDNRTYGPVIDTLDGKPSKVISIHTDLAYPWTDKKWIEGGHIIGLSTAPNGCATEWRCRRTGLVSSNIPPLWIPSKLATNLSDLAISSYVFNNTYSSLVLGSG